MGGSVSGFNPRGDVAAREPSERTNGNTDMAGNRWPDVTGAAVAIRASVVTAAAGLAAEVDGERIGDRLVQRFEAVL